MESSIKILIIGDSRVGKSSLLYQFTEGITFDDDNKLPLTLGPDLHTTLTNVVDGKEVRLSIFDTAGNERFRTFLPPLYEFCKGAILIYDVCSRMSFLNLVDWVDELERYSNLVTILVGNKIDNEDRREVSWEEGLKFAKQHNMMFVEASAKTKDGVHDIFEKLVKKIIQLEALSTNCQQRSDVNNISDDKPESVQQCPTCGNSI